MQQDTMDLLLEIRAAIHAHVETLVSLQDHLTILAPEPVWQSMQRLMRCSIAIDQTLSEQRST